MVQAGMGVTLLPALAVHTESSDLLKCIPFEAPAPKRTLGLFWRVGTPKNKCLEAIAATITHLIASQLKPSLS